ncbi:hypothetical protein DYB30_012898 [Aphanomyces astaci]|uniref:Uncharacterized protein n=1 Tax=Aphanomyces astaci TaxID=112090 RepID=A0A397CTH7_APHAT|nr:hypothetical protein DYB30_012898 [Aphanomyces astaci]
MDNPEPENTTAANPSVSHTNAALLQTPHTSPKNDFGAAESFSANMLWDSLVTSLLIRSNSSGMPKRQRQSNGNIASPSMANNESQPQEVADIIDAAIPPAIDPRQADIMNTPNHNVWTLLGLWSLMKVGAMHWNDAPPTPLRNRPASKSSKLLADLETLDKATATTHTVSPMEMTRNGLVVIARYPNSGIEMAYVVTNDDESSPSNAPGSVVL